MEALQVIESTYLLVNPGERLDSDSAGEITIADWCAEAGVVKIRSQISLRKADKLTPSGAVPSLVLQINGSFVIKAFTFDNDGDDIATLEWHGKISDDTNLSVVLKTGAN